MQVRQPKRQPDAYQLPEECPYERCSGDAFKPHGRKGETKAVRDLDYGKMKAHPSITALKDHPKGLQTNPPIEGCGDQSQVLYYL